MMSWPVILLLLAPPDAEPVAVTARLNTVELTVGQLHEIEINVAVTDGFTTTRTGGPPPIAQFKIPTCVELFGTVLKSPAERSYKGYLYEPFERAIGPGVSTVRFKLTAPPQPDDVIAFNVAGYVAPRDSGDARLFRFRLTLPLKPGAAATPADAGVSDWGDEPIVQLGAPAPAFRLPAWGHQGVMTAELSKGTWRVLTLYRSFPSVPCGQHLAALNEAMPAFTQRGVQVLAVSQEDADPTTFTHVLKAVPEQARFDVAADIGGTQTAGYQRVTTYLIDPDGIVRQIFPGTIEQRPPWAAVLHEVDRLAAPTPTTQP